MIVNLKGYQDPDNVHYVKAYVRMRPYGTNKVTWLAWWAYNEQLTGDRPELLDSFPFPWSWVRVTWWGSWVEVSEYWWACWQD